MVVRWTSDLHKAKSFFTAHSAERLKMKKCVPVPVVIGTILSLTLGNYIFQAVFPPLPDWKLALNYSWAQACAVILAWVMWECKG